MAMKRVKYHCLCHIWLVRSKSRVLPVFERQDNRREGPTGSHFTVYLPQFRCTVFDVLQELSQRRQWHPTPVLLPGKSHRWKSLVGCSPWDRKELDMTERLHFHFSLSCTGEGNGNPLQCSCLENPRDGGAWRAAIYGVAQSQTRLKWLRSNSSVKWQFKFWESHRSVFTL